MINVVWGGVCPACKAREKTEDKTTETQLEKGDAEAGHYQDETVGPCGTASASSSTGTTRTRTVSPTSMLDDMDELVKKFGNIPVRAGRASGFEVAIRTDNLWMFICCLMHDLGMDVRASFVNDGAELTKAKTSKLIGGGCKN